MADDAPPAERVRADTSPIAGRGLFTTVALATGERALVLDRPVGVVADFGLLNHSCDPLLGFDGDTALVALRDVPAGTELTVDYSTAIDDSGFVLYCHCGSTRCRQAVEGTDWQIPQLQKRYGSHWTPAILARLPR